MTALTVGSLFSGIGGLDLGLERAGMQVVWQSEIDPYCCRVLARHWPNVPNLGDITIIDWAEVPRVDLICGGFPCQDISQSGNRLGLAGPQSGLWREYARAVRQLRPDWVLVENVGDLAVRGLGDVLGDLASIGYDAEWQSIPAAAVGAPHLRERLFIVAYPDSETRGQPRPTDDRARPAPLPAGASEPRRRRSDVADTDSERPQGRGLPTVSRPPVPDAGWCGPRIFGPTARPGGQWAVEPDVGRVAHGIPHRVDRLRTLGNAVVPQVAEHIGRLILEAAA